MVPRLAFGQTFFYLPGVEPATGVDRGSTSQVSRVDKTTRFATFDTTGADAIGRAIASFSLAVPQVFGEGDQLDIVTVLGGPAEDGGRELYAGGIGYRATLGPGLTFFVNGDHSDYVLGSAAALPLDVRGTVTNAAVGLTREWQDGPAHRTRLTLSLGARSEEGTFIGGPVTDEDLRFLRLTFQDDKGLPFSSARRISVSATMGLSGLGASGPGNPLASALGSDPDFLRISGAYEASIPLAAMLSLNAGAVFQWTDDSLPVSQRCGYGTNAYARGFDRSFVNGDRCLGGRVELAHDLKRPDFRAARLDATQLFAGVDAGRVWDNANAVSPASDDGWSSLSAGLRVLRGDFLGEIQATRILDEPLGAFPQSRSRLWLRLAVRF